MRTFIIFLIAITLYACSPHDGIDADAFEVYCEIVAHEAKPLALHRPLSAEDADNAWAAFQEIADRYGVQIYREEDFPATALFPSEGTDGKTVILIYRGARLEQYHQLKADIMAAGSDPVTKEALARRLGRLLGYTPQGVNSLLSENTGYSNLYLHGVEQQVTHLYYDELQEAVSFYKDVLGLNMIDSNTVQISADAFLRLHPVSEEHPVEQPKSTAIALLTDQLPDWYAYIQQKNIPVKYTYKPKEGGPHDGFVAIDPGGYLLEFEQFKQHPENELFMAVLSEAEPIPTKIGQLDFYGSITWTYHRDVLAMQNFYEEVLGFRMVADQGWTKIYQTSSAGFIGLVDERRGMEDYADSKAVEIQWNIADLTSWDAYANDQWSGYEGQKFTGPEQYIYRVDQDIPFDTDMTFE